MHQIIDWVLNDDKSKWLISFVFASMIACAAGIQFLTITSDYTVFFEDDDPDLKLLEELQQTYTKTDNVFVMIKSSSSNIYNKESISLIHELTESLWLVPHVSRVDSVTNYSFSFADGDDIYIEQFIYDSDDISSKRIELMSENIPIEKDLVGKLVTQGGDYTGINLTVLLPEKNLKAEIQQVNKSIDKVILRFQENHPKYEFYITGITTMNGAFMEVAKKDFATLIPLMMLVVLVLAGLILGSVKVTFVLFAVVLFSFLGALGIAGWMGIELSAPSISAPVILFPIVVASTIHIFTSLKHENSENSEPKKIILESYKKNITPITFSYLTTIIGFLAMNTSSSPPFRDLGNIVVIGVMLTLIQIFTLLPFFLSKITLYSKRTSGLDITPFSSAVAEFVISRRKSILFLLLPSACLFSSFAINNNFDDNLIEYFSESVKFRQDAEKVDQYFSGNYSIDYSIETEVEDAIFTYQYLLFIEHFENWLNKQPEVVSVESPLHRIKDLNRLVHGDDDSFYNIAIDSKVNAQNFLLYEMSLPYGRDTKNYISMDKSSLKVTARMSNKSAKEVIAFERKVNMWLSQQELHDFKVKYSSSAIIFSHVGISNISNLLNGAMIALAVISFAMVFVFRSVIVGFISLIPNILPIVTAFSVWSFLSGDVSMGLAGVAAMTIGVVVDDSVHFLFRYQNGLKNGLTPENSIRQTFNTTMQAIMISSALLVIGFLLLSTSSFGKNSDMGILTSITIFSALFFDIILLPALAMTFIKGNQEPSKLADVHDAEGITKKDLLRI